MNFYLASEGGYKPAWGPPTSTLKYVVQNSRNFLPLLIYIFDSFCEVDYEFTPYIAELFNTLTNIAYSKSSLPIPILHPITPHQVILGIRGILNHHALIPTASLFNLKTIGPKLPYLALINLGLASSLFHSSLKYGTQMCDEFSMLIATFIVFYRLLSFSQSTFSPRFLLVDMSACNTLRSLREQIGMPWAALLEMHGYWHILTGIGVYIFMVLVECLAVERKSDIAADGLRVSTHPTFKMSPPNPLLSALGKISHLLSLTLFLTSIFTSPASAATDTYDYIVIGSGPGGGPLASNLARANYTVLLLDAGDQSVQGTDGQYPPSITWDFFVKHYEDKERTMKFSHLTWRRADGSYWVGRDNPPSDAKLLGVYYPRGATVGGSSMINEMCTFLPSESDWDYIVQVTGDKSWSAANMRKIFMQIEHNNYLPKNTSGHGFDGYFQVGLEKPNKLQNPGLQVVQAIAASLGKDPSKVLDMVKTDPNGDDPKRDQTEGIFGLPRHVKPNFERFSARDYIVDTLNAKFPLTLQMNALATRVLFGNSTKCGAKPRATGVEYLQGTSLYKGDSRYVSSNKGVLKQAIARKEVIISGGAFNSPQLLMLSGIGPQDQLKQFNISVVVNSPGVGNNLMDNQEMPVVGQVTTSGSGMPGGCTMLKTKHAAYDERDILVFGGPFVFRGFWPANQTNTALPQDAIGTYGMSMVKMHPQNHLGTVKLVSSNPQDMPEINFNHFAEGKEIDMGAMKDTIAWARKVYGNVSTPTGPVQLLEPPCPAGVDANGACGKADEDWITAQTFGHHPTSTCAIGNDTNPNAVLDSRFRVRGVSGLRVVDASTFPRIPGSFPVVATFMVSQKATNTLLEDAKLDQC
ncbi:hypothetical protein G7Y89_g982 [Cudoniella acicularis]|uniref:Glucose-methanol-choline oxidoreductase N-terminal domain-containing protein n=1 Tax=Cudoniella acicularis TaxID=354080 RepID=A0A8H4WAP3_9HELO|nr:hypothetical protein G7Y89_g982 [Cudoniella acicularis]